MDIQFDIVVIGSGPGGYTAAIRAAQLGYKTAIIEKYPALGGTCTNVGCIPSKALLHGTEIFDMLRNRTEKQGIDFQNLTIDFKRMMERKMAVVKQNTDGVRYLMKKNRVEVFEGVAKFINNKKIVVAKTDSASIDIISAYFIIATGSKPATLPGVALDKKRIITSTEALSLQEKPGEMVIIGGGVIGVEMASVFHRIGVKVALIEYADCLVSAMDRELGRELYKILSNKGIEIILGAKVDNVVSSSDKVSVSFIDEQQKNRLYTADYCLLAVGRKPYTTGLALDNTAVKIDKSGRVETDENLQTAEPNIYAIGDVVKGVMLAHKAEDEAVFAIEHINGKSPRLNYSRIPNVIYTSPEVASVGFTEEELKQQQIAYNVGRFPFYASAKARTADDTDGFLKVLADPKYGEVLGVHIIGGRAADLISQAVMAMEFELTDADLARISYAHPTFSEAFKDAYLSSSGAGSINI
jgi:dihydrolipoamide dehydrogenase